MPQPASTAATTTERVIASRTIISLPAVWRSIGDEIGHDKSRVDDAAAVLDNRCAEFEDLLDKKGDSEGAIHQWLKDERHHLFLHPDAETVWSKIPFGKTVSDFVVRHSDGTYRLIEIERATIAFFRKNSEPAQPFNHAFRQVRDWQQYVRDNVLTVRSELGLHGIDQPRGVVILGRDSAIHSPAAQKCWRDLKGRDPEVYTYDEIIKRVRTLANRLRASRRS